MIFISAGHHKDKPGACWGGFCEYPETSRWADELARLLGSRAQRVPDGVLRETVDTVNAGVHQSGETCLAVELHFNSAVNAAGRPIGAGSETLYYPGSGAGRLAAKCSLV